MPPGLLFARAKVGEHFKLAENVETEAVEKADRCLVACDRTRQELAVATDPRGIEHETCKRIANAAPPPGTSDDDRLQLCLRLKRDHPGHADEPTVIDGDPDVLGPD